MRKVLCMYGLLGIILIVSCSKQNAEAILNKAYQKCQSIDSGHYEMTHYMKYMSGKDTSSSVYSCYFKKLQDDSLYSSAFHYKKSYDGGYLGDIMYTGEDFVRYSIEDSSGVIMSKTLWAEDIDAYSHNYTFYTPLIDRESHPMPYDSAFVDDKNIFSLIGEEIINNINCYHIRMNTIPKNDSTDSMKTLRKECNYWISKQDYLPIQYSIAFDLVMNNDTMYQFERNVLSNYELNTINDKNQLKLESIPKYINLKDYTPYKSPELLPKDTIAPNWSLRSLEDEIINLSDFKGQLLLIDFFYKSCYPCMLALPALQRLHEKYSEKGLKVIGIDPYDTKEKDEIDTFLAKRGVTYTVLLGGKDVAKDYHVSGYPTIYLIDRQGKILFTQVGYGDGTEVKIEEIIKNNISN